MGVRERRLRKARKIRHQRSHVIAALSSGRVTLKSVLEDPPASLRTMRVFDVMMKTPQLGEPGVNRCLRTSKVWPTTRLGDLSLEERQTIVSHLPPRARDD